MRGRGHGLVIGALALVGAFATDARADEPVQVPAETHASPAAAPATAPVRREWYGAYIIPLDVLALMSPFVAFGSGSATGAATALTLGALGYSFGGPLIHAGNHRSGPVVAGSLGLRLGVPLLAGLFAYEASHATVRTCTNYDSDLVCSTPDVVYAILGAYIGMVVASVIDISAVAWKDGTSRAATPATPTQSFRLTPAFGMARDEGSRRVPTFGVAGTF